MTAVSRFSRWAVLYLDIVILAGAAYHGASKLLGVVAVDCAHLPPARPLGLNTDSGEPVLLGQDRMCDGEPGCKGAGLFQIDGEAEYHAAAHVDDYGQRRSLDRLPVLLIDDNDVHGRVVDLGDG